MIFRPDGDQHFCRVFRDEENEMIRFAPAEADKATKIIGIALGMESMPVLPDFIPNSPFVVRFLEEGFCRLEREDGDGSVRFLWEEGDSLITTIQAALGMAINVRTLGGPVGAPSQSYNDNF